MMDGGGTARVPTRSCRAADEPVLRDVIMRRPLFAACLLVAGCSRASSGGPPPASSADLSAPAGKFAHPCTVLRRSDAEALLGTTDLHEVEEPGPPADARCAWSVTSGRGLVELRVHFPTRKEGFDRAVPDRNPVTGVGDRAYVQKRLSWAHVDVLKGDQTFFVQIERGGLAPAQERDPEQMRSDAITLARTIVSRM